MGKPKPGQHYQLPAGLFAVARLWRCTMVAGRDLSLCFKESSFRDCSMPLAAAIPLAAAHRTFWPIRPVNINLLDSSGWLPSCPADRPLCDNRLGGWDLRDRGSLAGCTGERTVRPSGIPAFVLPALAWGRSNLQ